MKKSTPLVRYSNNLFTQCRKNREFHSFAKNVQSNLRFNPTDQIALLASICANISNWFTNDPTYGQTDRLHSGLLKLTVTVFLLSAKLANLIPDLDPEPRKYTDQKQNIVPSKMFHKYFISDLHERLLSWRRSLRPQRKTIQLFKIIFYYLFFFFLKAHLDPAGSESTRLLRHM